MSENPLGTQKRAYYSAPLAEFVRTDPERVFAEMAARSDFDIALTQRDAWLRQADLLREALRALEGAVYLEFSIPRMGSRVDTLVIVGPVLKESVQGVAQATAAAQPKAPVIAFSTDNTVAGNGTFLLSFTLDEEVSRIVDFASKQGLKRFALIGLKRSRGWSIAFQR